MYNIILVFYIILCVHNTNSVYYIHLSELCIYIYIYKIINQRENNNNMCCYHYYYDPKKKKIKYAQNVVHAHSIYRSLSLFLLSPAVIYLYMYVYKVHTTVQNHCGRRKLIYGMYTIIMQKYINT